MWAPQERDITLFGAECVASGYRGRRTGSQIGKQTSRRMAIVFVALLMGFASAATAITVRHAGVTERNISAGANLNPTTGSPHLASVLW
jgi:hypothetical protein